MEQLSNLEPLTVLACNGKIFSDILVAQHRGEFRSLMVEIVPSLDNNSAGKSRHRKSLYLRNQ